METAFSEHIIMVSETNIELFRALNQFVERMNAHIEKFPNYDYTIEPLGGKPGAYKARVIIKRYDTQETEFAKRDTGSYGAL